jgi:hypothetical protein
MPSARLFRPVAVIATTAGSVQLDLPDHPEQRAVTWIVQGDARVLRLLLPGLIRHRHGCIRALVQIEVITARPPWRRR